LSAPVIIDRFNILVDQLYAVLARGQGGQERQRRDRHVRFHVEEIERVLETPEAGVKSRIDENDMRHERQLS